MFCPRCGSNQSDELKFCKVCGANLLAVRQAVETRETDQKSDRNRPWFAEMALSDAESKRRKEELDHLRGIAPEVRRYNEIRGGVITGSVGLGFAIFLSVFMQGLTLSGNFSPQTAEILSRLWVAGVIPLIDWDSPNNQRFIREQEVSGNCEASRYNWFDSPGKGYESP
jgi:hypothetical protein